MTTRMFGCMAHNHPNNPTMKNTSWLTKRKIAKFLLLGHSRMDICYKLMPKLHQGGQKKVDLAVVNRVQKKMSADKHHKGPYLKDVRMISGVFLTPFLPSPLSAFGDDTGEVAYSDTAYSDTV